MAPNNLHRVSLLPNHYPQASPEDLKNEIDEMDEQVSRHAKLNRKKD